MISEPWRRVEAIAIPHTPDLVTSLQEMDHHTLEVLVHANLLARDPSPAGHETWRRLWATIAADPDINDDVADMVDAWLAACVDQDTTTDPQLAKRIAKFSRTCHEVLDRLENPLGWAQPYSRRFNSQGRRVIDAFVNAISDHRNHTSDPRPHDVQLWHVLAEVALDPDHPDLAQTMANTAARSIPADDQVTADLAWAGKRARGFNVASVEVITQLINAITLHRRATDTPTPMDAELWLVLAEHGLDPTRGRLRRRPPRRSTPSA